MSVEEARAREEQAELAYTEACVAVLEAERTLRERIERRREAAERHTLASVERTRAEQVPGADGADVGQRGR
jgi:hypothetical protein